MSLKLIEDVAGEELIPLSELPKSGLIPRERRGRKTAPSTFYRWAATGCRGVQLEVIRAGNILCTTRSAVIRFYRRLTDPMAATVRPSTHRRARDRELKKIGMNVGGN
jgi:hypothetical protein